MASSLRISYAIQLSLAAHALLGDEQDASGDDEDAANDVEDRGTNATGAGKLGSLVVLDLIQGVSSRIKISSTSIFLQSQRYRIGKLIIYIEVKTTTGPYDEPFFLTNTEVEISKEEKNKYYLYRVYNFKDGKGKIGVSKGSLERFCGFPTEYKVVLKK